MKIDLFAPHFSRYNVLHSLTSQLHSALLRNKVDSRVLTVGMGSQDIFLERLLRTPPDCTLTFNAIKPNEKGIFLADFLKIPHLSCLVDSCSHYFLLINELIDSLMNTRFSIYSSVDRDTCKIFKEIGFNKIFFLPHAADKNLLAEVDKERAFNCVIFSSPIAYEQERENWKKSFPLEVFKALNQAAEEALEKDLSFPRAFASAMGLFLSNGKISPEIVRYAKPLTSLELYLRGLDRAQMLDSIEGIKVDLFGVSSQNSDWSTFLKSSSTLTVHEPVFFNEALNLMKNSKILLNSCSGIHDGGHERLFSAMAAGALVITSKTPYLEENFTHGEDLLFFDLHKKDKIKDLIEHYLANEEERKEIAKSGQEKVLASHTWDSRAKILIKTLPNLLKEIYS